MHRAFLLRSLQVSLVVALAARESPASPVVYLAIRPNPSAIQSTVDTFRADLGPNNGTGPGPFVGGRREINWDAVPDAVASPNAFPGNFFSQAAAPRADRKS